MEFYIKQNATLPVLKMQVVKDGRAGYQQLMQDLKLFTHIVEQLQPIIVIY